MPEELPIRLPPVSRLRRRPETAAGRLAPLIGVAVGIVLTLLVRYQLDLDAWRIAVSYLDCFVLTLLILGLPLAVFANGLLRLVNVPAKIRVTLFCLLAAAFAWLGIENDTTRIVIGIPAPPGATVLSSRSFATPAGGGDEYQFVQLGFDSQEQFEALMAGQGFTLRTFDEY